jgi:hypothetical protein
MPVVCGGWDCRECQAPGTPILDRIWRPSVVFAARTPAGVSKLGVTFHRAFKQSTPRQPCEDWAVIDWFRLLSHCLGRAGRHRRTGTESLFSTPIPPFTVVGLQLKNVGCEISDNMKPWLAFRSDGAYPRPEGRGIAPVPLINYMYGALADAVRRGGSAWTGPAPADGVFERRSSIREPVCRWSGRSARESV